MNNRHPLWAFISLLITSAMVFTACGSAVTEPPEAPPEPEEPAQQVDMIQATPPELTFPPPLEGEFECIEGDQMVCTIGENEDVVVVIPWQPEHAAFLYAVNLSMEGGLGDFKNESRDEFSPHRLVVNFELLIDPSYREYISVFLPPIELGARYVEADVIAAGGLENLELGFWDENNEYWVSFRQHSKYEFTIEGDETGGYVWVIIPEWGDRRIGFG